MILYKYIENDTINICNNIDTDEFNLLINLIEKYNIKIMAKDKIQSIVNLEDYINKNPDVKPNNILFRFISYLQIESSHKIIDEEEYNDVVDYNFN